MRYNMETAVTARLHRYLLFSVGIFLLILLVLLVLLVLLITVLLVLKLIVVLSLIFALRGHRSHLLFYRDTGSLYQQAPEYTSKTIKTKRKTAAIRSIAACLRLEKVLE